MKLRDKTSIITGGNTGIGRAVSLALANEGSNIIIAWHDKEDEANSLVEEINAKNVEAKLINVDVTNESSVQNLFAKSISCFGKIDVLVNNAGIQKSQPIHKISLNDWETMISVHLRGAFLCSKESSIHMINSNSGSIINVCSQLGYIGKANYTAYSTAKGGLIAFTRALARELAPHGIRVNGVCPGLVDTGFDSLSKEAKKEHASRLPMGRLGYPSDIASAFVFLASNEAAYYCGQFLHPNGGEIMP